MTFDENELRKALGSRSGEPTLEYRARLKQALASPRPETNWMAIVAVIVVTGLTATAVGALSYSRYARVGGPVASGPPASGSRLTSPSPVPTAGFPDCVLPYADYGGGDHYHGGFISGTQGQFTPDSQGRVDKSGTLLVTRATPTLKGAGNSSWDGVSYDSAVKRWVPAPTAHVRSDGRAYAYDETFDVNPNGPPTTRIHVVTLDDGKDRVVYSVNQSRVVLGYEPEGIYLMETSYGSDAPQSGLWLLNPVTGAAIKLPVGSGYMMVVSRGGLWVVDTAMNSDQHLYRVNVSTGAIQTWVDTTDWGYLWFYGVDSNGDPLVSVDIGVSPASSARPPSGLSTGGLYVFTAPNMGTRIGTLPFGGEAVSDSHGTWIATQGGLYLVAPGREPALVSGVTGGTVAGPCS